jgi:small multidrug resistance pump
VSAPVATTTWLLAAAAVLCNAGAQLLMKRAGIQDGGNWRAWLDPWLASALALYGVSFGVTALVYARLPLTVASPAMAGAIFVLISAFSVLFLGESLGAAKLAGMALIVGGIVLLAQSS